MRKMMPIGILMALIATLGGAIIFFKGQSSRSDSARPNTILFVYASRDTESLDIFSIKPNGAGRTRLTKSEEWEFDPTWSPNGKRIAFAALVNLKQRRTDIYVMHADGSGRTRLTQSKTDTLAGSPTWSPDGKHIAFHTVRRDVQGNKIISPQIHVIDANGRNHKRLGQGIGPVWSPDGKKILYYDIKSGTSTMNIDGRNAKAIGIKTPILSAPGAWSPDGIHIAYVNAIENQAGIFIANTANWKSRLLTKIEGGAVGVLWSADGKRIIFTRITSLALGLPERSIIYAMNVDGRSSKPLTKEEALSLTQGGVYATVIIQAHLALSARKK